MSLHREGEDPGKRKDLKISIEERLLQRVYNIRQRPLGPQEDTFIYLNRISLIIIQNLSSWVVAEFKN